MPGPIYYEVPFDKAESFIKSWSDKEITSPLALTPHELTIMEVMLADTVDEHNKSVNYSEWSAFELKDYGVQYTGYYNKRDEKLIWLNGFFLTSHISADANYKADFSGGVLFVLDGGKYYFKATLNLSTIEMVRFGIHGSA